MDTVCDVCEGIHELPNVRCNYVVLKVLSFTIDYHGTKVFTPLRRNYIRSAKFGIVFQGANTCGSKSLDPRVQIWDHLDMASLIAFCVPTNSKNARSCGKVWCCWSIVIELFSDPEL